MSRRGPLGTPPRPRRRTSSAPMHAAPRCGGMPQPSRGPFGYLLRGRDGGSRRLPKAFHHPTGWGSCPMSGRSPATWSWAAPRTPAPDYSAATDFARAAPRSPSHEPEHERRMFVAPGPGPRRCHSARNPVPHASLLRGPAGPTAWMSAARHCSWGGDVVLLALHGSSTATVVFFSNSRAPAT